MAFGQILPRAVIDIAAARARVNVHASLLPRLRGAAPIQWAIANGDSETGVTTMHIDEGLDTGPLLLPRAPAIGAGGDARRSSSRASPGSAASSCSRPFAGLERGTLSPGPQDAHAATLAPMLRKEDGRLDWSLGARAIACRARGFDPWPGAYDAPRRTAAQAPPRPSSRRLAPSPSQARSSRSPRRGWSWPAATARASSSTRFSPRAARPCRPRPWPQGARLRPGVRLG